MTKAMVAVAQTVAPDLEFEGWTSTKGPASIQGSEDGQRATPPLLELVREADRQRAQGIIIGCFDDTALTQAAKIAHCPVIGIGQASYHYAALRSWRFSVVTTLPVSVPIIERNIQDFGFGSRVGQVRASGVPVLALEEDPERSLKEIVGEAKRAEADDNVDAIVLGCAGMVNVTASVRGAVELGVIDPIESAAAAMRWLI